MANIFTDSKTFVDMSLKDTPDNTMEKFNKLMESSNQSPTNEQIKDFVNVSIFRFLVAGQTDFQILEIWITWLEEPVIDLLDRV